MYLALYRKYRPQVFSDVISQEHITTTLTNQLKNGQTSHAYLFTGSRGTGKTTCAKILAKAINCLDSKDGNPCLECSACLGAEDTPDIIEIDAASNTGVDTVRSLKEEAVYTPLSCRYKVYIIDEVHMLSIAAFNALLKLIEEPPAHVVFIFATTEIHKIPATILSRCQRFDFRRIDIEDSKKRLLEIAEKEGMTLDEDAAFLISRISDGGMRDALSLLDQCFAMSSHVTEETVRACAGVSGTDHLFEIAEAVIEEDSGRAITVLDGLVRRSKSALRLMEELISHYRILMLLKAGAERSVLRISADEEARYIQQNTRYSMESILRALSILSEAVSGANRSRNEQLACEMCLIKLCMPVLDINEKALSGRIDALERTVKDLTLNSLQNSIASEIMKLAPAPAAPLSAPEAEEKISLADAIAAVSPDATPAEEEILPLPFEEPMAIPLVFETEEQPFAPDAPDAFPPEPVTVQAPAEEMPEPPSLKEALGISEEAPPAEEYNDDPNSEPWMKKKEEETEPSEEGYAPFRECKNIVENLGFSAKMLFGETTALINENTVMVCGTEMQKSFAVTDYADAIKEAVSRAIGRRVGLVAQKGENRTNEEENYVKDFLSYASAQGVKIKKQ